MLIVGELINASRKSVATAIENRDEDFIRKLARDQAEAGAAYIDVNAGVFVEDETQHLEWLVKTVQDEVEAPCCIDSPNPKVIEAALAMHKGPAMINSISLEKGRYEAMIPFLAGSGHKIIGLCMGEGGMPRTVEERLVIAKELIGSLEGDKIDPENILIDPLVQPVATDKSFGKAFLDAIEQVMTRFPKVHTICGLSNVSYGLPERKYLNRTFMTMAVDVLPHAEGYAPAK